MDIYRVHTDRIFNLNTAEISEVNTGPVIYWMTRDQRIDDNWGFIYAADTAFRHGRSLAVVFSLRPAFDISDRSRRFMLRGLSETAERAGKLKVPFIILPGEPPPDHLAGFVRRHRACAVICDFDPLREKTQWRKKTAEILQVPLIEVDSHNILPCRTISPKQEFGAHTLRKKIEKRLTEFLTPFPGTEDLPYCSKNTAVNPLLLTEAEKSRTVLDDHLKNEPDSSGPGTGLVFKPGRKEGLKRQRIFLREKLYRYSEDRNNPCLDGQSGLSPYFSFRPDSAPEDRI